MIEPLLLAKNKKEWGFILLFLLLIFSINISILYSKYNNFKLNEIYTTTAKILNIYKKQNYNILKLQSKYITFFTSYKNNNLKKLDNISITIITKNITFIDYIKGFYALNFNIYKLQQKKTFLNNAITYVSLQHNNIYISELFNTLFFSIHTSKYLKTISSNYGISHLFAISGFHLGVLSFILYWFIYIFYKPLKQKYFPYRNEKFDILIIVSTLLLAYLIFLGLIPSLLRAFIMFILGIYFMRNNIKILSFYTLLLVVLFIIALYPKLLFSLSLWFSVSGVFYIFLFLKYFKNINKIVLFILFNIWLYLALNPITHFFFPIVSNIQLFSPIATIGFSLFYPIELFLHIINHGGLFDSYIEFFLNYNIITKSIFTAKIFFIYYIIVSLLAIKYKKIFILQNISFILFNFYLFTS